MYLCAWDIEQVILGFYFVSCVGGHIVITIFNHFKILLLVKNNAIIHLTFTISVCKSIFPTLLHNLCHISQYFYWYKIMLKFYSNPIFWNHVFNVTMFEERYLLIFQGIPLSAYSLKTGSSTSFRSNFSFLLILQCSAAKGVWAGGGWLSGDRVCSSIHYTWDYEGGEITCCLLTLLILNMKVQLLSQSNLGYPTIGYLDCSIIRPWPLSVYCLLFINFHLKSFSKQN